MGLRPADEAKGRLARMDPETYIDSEGQERCDECEELLHECVCVCSDCGDSIQECACDEGYHA